MDLKSTSQATGIKKWTSWLHKDIFPKNKRPLKKLPFSKQRKLIQLFNNLFHSGFHLSEILSFLRRSQLLEADYIDVMQNSLLAGGNLSLMMSQLGFSDTIVTQMALADIHGNSQRSLVKIDAYLTSMGAVRKKLLEVMTYPVMLLGFLVLIMVGLNHYLLPQLEGSNLATQLIQHFPLLF